MIGFYRLITPGTSKGRIVIFPYSPSNIKVNPSTNDVKYHLTVITCLKINVCTIQI